ncbi:leucine/isoleucine/valine transporter ATP-binding subunit [compost metagenome]
MVLIEHDMGMVMSISDHIVVLDHGIVIAEGGPDAIRNDPKVIAAYLGADEEEVV